MKKFTNALIHETSPYLLQHAHNPVNWLPWNDQAWEHARKSNKPVIISIGYSACHWCHVMEHESFEDEAVANIMNEYFVCIKVDREERPDVDQVYMDAVQLMTGRGGWPLNCIALPDGRPIYGGTYFPKQHWMEILINLNDLIKNDIERVNEYADKLTSGILQTELIKTRKSDEALESKLLHQMVKRWKTIFDADEGGPKKAPKFPMPDNYIFLLRYAHQTNDAEVLNHVKLTLDKMAYGGIYDQIGGGFARYSVDEFWKIPHFEKMLYDNAQLISLYTYGWLKTRDDHYQRIVDQTIEFCKRELLSPEKMFWSALDADSEGEEGKFYVWTKEELKKQLTEDEFHFVEAYYNINETGYWEHGNFVLMRTHPDEYYFKIWNISKEEFNKNRKAINDKLLLIRSKRIRPGLDDKTLASWNALMIKGLSEASAAFNQPEYYLLAKSAMQGLLTKFRNGDGGLFRTYKNGKATINGFLDDYVFTVDALLSLYQCDFDESWILQAEELVNYIIEKFHDDESGMFFYTSSDDAPLIARKTELSDNVTPSSNGVMANVLFRLGTLFDRADYLQLSKQMLMNIQEFMVGYGPGHSSWAALHMNFTFPFYEIAVSGKLASDKALELKQMYLPNAILMAGTQNQTAIKLLESKLITDKTLIYVCRDKTCNLPVENTEDVRKQVEQKL